MFRSIGLLYKNKIQIAIVRVVAMSVGTKQNYLIRIVVQSNPINNIIYLSVFYHNTCEDSRFQIHLQYCGRGGFPQAPPLARICNPCPFCKNVYPVLAVKSYKIEFIGIMELLFTALSRNIVVMQM